MNYSLVVYVHGSNGCKKILKQPATVYNTTTHAWVHDKGDLLHTNFGMLPENTFSCGQADKREREIIANQEVFDPLQQKK